MSGYTAFAQYYDALTGNVNYRDRASYFAALAQKHSGKKPGGLLLDLACGTGSLAVELAGLGYEVIGADASPDMLAVAAGKAQGRILLLCQPMTALDLYGTVDYTVCALDSLNHLPDEEALGNTFAGVSLFTNPGGLFLFDVNTAYKHREVLADNAYVYEPEGLFCCWRNAYRPADGGVDIALDFFESLPGGGWRRSGERFSEQLFSQQQIERQLCENGMELLAVYAEDSFDAPGERTQRLVYVAGKR